uniref:Uncharacterized protein n=1 Tax=Arundo donax TaxID=35708 RepID=A0A0A9AY94_ARUDO
MNMSTQFSYYVCKIKEGHEH